MRNVIEQEIRESCAIKQKILMDQKIIDSIQQIAEKCIQVYRAGGKTMLAGNGGSAADAQHIAAELSGKLNLSRPPIPSLALTTNSSELTAIANDFGYDNVFSRLVEANGLSGDLLIGISTSGKSLNILRALEKSKNIGILTVGFTGMLGSSMLEVCDYCVMIPSENTQRIQECHILVGHILCSLVESALFGTVN